MVLDTRCCPLCGQPNYCVMAAGQSKKPCWCSEMKISLALLGQVPPEVQGKVCICKSCADAFEKERAADRP